MKTQRSQQGTILIVSLFFLLLLSIIAATTTETNSMQLRMAGNEQARIEAQQRTMSAIDAIIDNTDNTPVIGDIGYRICAAGSNASGCDAALINVPSAVSTTPSNTTLNYHVTRVGPLEASPPSMSEDEASSASFYRVARYEVSADYDGSAAKQANSRIIQGMLVRIPAANN